MPRFSVRDFSSALRRRKSENELECRRGSRQALDAPDAKLKARLGRVFRVLSHSSYAVALVIEVLSYIDILLLERRHIRILPCASRALLFLWVCAGEKVGLSWNADAGLVRR